MNIPFAYAIDGVEYHVKHVRDTANVIDALVVIEDATLSDFEQAQAECSVLIGHAQELYEYLTRHIERLKNES